MVNLGPGIPLKHEGEFSVCFIVSATMLVRYCVTRTWPQVESDAVHVTSLARADAHVRARVASAFGNAFPSTQRLSASAEHSLR